VHAFKTRHYFTGVEIGFTCPIGHKSFMSRWIPSGIPQVTASRHHHPG
jgi:hypothetical protein